MSSPELFPSQAQVTQAYSEVLIARCNLQKDSIYLSRSLDPNVTIIQVKPLQQEAVEELEAKHGDLLHQIGVAVSAREVTVDISGERPVDAYTLVPELLSSQRYLDYMEMLGKYAVIGEPVHYHLAKDVLDNIYLQVDFYDEALANAEHFERADNDETATVTKESRDLYLEQFRTVMPFYDSPGLANIIPSYMKLFNRFFQD